jgi:hypothetical protein
MQLYAKVIACFTSTCPKGKAVSPLTFLLCHSDFGTLAGHLRLTSVFTIRFTLHHLEMESTVCGHTPMLLTVCATGHGIFLSRVEKSNWWLLPWRPSVPLVERVCSRNQSGVVAGAGPPGGDLPALSSQWNLVWIARFVNWNSKLILQKKN